MIAHNRRAYYWLPGGASWRARIVWRDARGMPYTAEMLARRALRLAERVG